MCRFKGQLISKCPFGVKTSSKVPMGLFLDFCLEIFVASLGIPGSVMGLPVGFLIYDIMYLLSPQEAQKASRKPPRKLQKFQGRNPEIISLVFWKKF